MPTKEHSPEPVSPNSLFADCENEVNALRRSPCFAMSRGGKELFHTNFLSFLLEFDPEMIENEHEKGVVKAVQESLIGVLFNPGGEEARRPSSVQTWREKNSLDLVVLAAPTINDDQFPGRPGFGGCGAMVWAKSRSKAPECDLGLVGVVIEAKFKALATQKQLSKYDERLNTEICIDLHDPLPTRGERKWGSVGINLVNRPKSDKDFGKAIFVARFAPAGESGSDNPDSAGKTSNPMFACGSGRILRVLLSPEAPAWLEDTSWKHVEWGSLVETIKKTMDWPEKPTLPDTGLLVLLRDYVGFTSQLLEIIKKTANSVKTFCQDQSSSRFSELADVHKDFAKLRIHDVVGKIAFDQLRECLLGKLLKSLPRRDQSNEFCFDSETFFSRGTPGLVLEFAYTNPDQLGRKLGLGIQIQGTKYRHYLTVSKPQAKGGTLLQLALQMGKPNGESMNSKGWWNVDARPRGVPKSKEAFGGGKRDVVHDAGFHRFGAEAFLHTQTDIAGLCFPALVEKVKASIKLARSILEDEKFRTSAVKFVDTAEGAN